MAECLTVAGAEYVVHLPHKQKLHGKTRIRC